MAYEDFDYRQAQEELMTERGRGGMALCPRTFMKPCRFCEFIGMPAGTKYLRMTLSWHSYPGILYSRDPNFQPVYPESARNHAQRFRAREHIWTYVIFTRKDPSTPYLFRVGWQLFQKLRSLAASESYKRFWDPKHGTELEVRKFMDKNQRYSYDVIPQPKAASLPDMSVLERLPQMTVELVVNAMENEQQRPVPLLELGKLDAGVHYIRLLPIVKHDPEIWFLRLYWHFGLTQQELDAINAGERDPSIFLFDTSLSDLRGGSGGTVEEDEEDDVPDEFVGSSTKTEEEDIEEPEEEVEEEEEEEEAEEEDEGPPACFGDKEYFDPNDEVCTQECSYFEECKKAIKKAKMKRRK